MTPPSLEFECRTCGGIHHTLPAWHFDAPLQVLAVPQAERAARVELSEDDCVIDATAFYLKGLLGIPIEGSPDPFVWGVWLSVSAESYRRFVTLYDDVGRSADEQFFGWLCNELPSYPSTQLLKAMLHVREYPMRPWVELEPTSHPLAIDQRDGVTKTRTIELTKLLLHRST